MNAVAELDLPCAGVGELDQDQGPAGAGGRRLLLWTFNQADGDNGTTAGASTGAGRPRLPT